MIAFVRFPSFVSPKGRRILTNKGVHVVTACNFTPMPRHGYRIGVPRRCAYLERLNTDATEYGGSGLGNLGRVEVEAVPSHGFAQSVVLTLPPLATIWLVPELDEDPAPLPEEKAATDVKAEEPSAAPAPEAPPAPGAGPTPEASDEEIDRSIADESTLVSLPIRRRPSAS